MSAPTNASPQAQDTSVFPDPVYARTVLAPLFDAARTSHVAGFRAIDAAHCVMLADTGILTRNEASAIARALAEIAREIDPARLVYTGEVEDYFFLVERALKDRVGPDLGGRLHTARSRNDIDHTLFKLALKERIDAILARGHALLAALIETAARERDTIVVAYTHGQPAQPSTFGHYLAAMIEVALRDVARLEEARAIVDLCPMGAAAITTSGFPIDRARVAALLGFSAPLRNSYSCIAAVDYQTATFSALELLFLHLGRPIQDFQTWSSFEVGQLYVPNALVQVSSIMPQKRNPVPIEHLRHLASQVVGRARAMRDVMHNTPFTDMNDSEGETQEMGYQAFAVAERALDLLAALVAQVRIDPARVAQNVARSCITITELADTLVRREGLSFRQAHEIAAATARAVVAAGGTLVADGHAPFAAAFREAIGREPGLTAADFAVAVSAEHFVATRDRYGGPAPAAMDEALAAYRDARDGLATRIAERRAREAAASAERERAFAALIEER